MRLIKTPTLISTVANKTLAIKSIATTNKPPRNADSGTTNLLSFPMRSLTIWGTTKPTKASIPLTETAADVAKEVKIKHNKRVLFTLIPNDEA